MSASTRTVGTRLKRKEDPRFITGTGRYTDDVKLPGMLHLTLLRSDRGHARIVSIDTTAARGMPGVIGVFTGRDLQGQLGGVPCGVRNAEGKHYSTGVPLNVPDYPALAIDKVVFQGQNVAAVVATDPYLGADAVEAIEVEYEDLPAVIDPEAGALPGSPLVHEQFGSNVAFRIPMAPDPALAPGVKEKADALFASADFTASFRFENQRLIPMSMEGRAVVADYDPGREQMTVWTSSQIPHIARTLIAMLLQFPENQLRVISPDVGGAFGCKLNLYAEELLVPYLSKRLRRPVKWTERRREAFTSTIHGRGQVQRIEIAFDKNGHWLAARGQIYLDVGAMMQLLTPAVGNFTVVMMTGCYRPQAVYVEHIAVFTNKMSTDAYRGAGRPEATMIAERAMDLIALKTGIDPAEVRRRNFHTEFPVVTPMGLVYDSGDYGKALDRALEVVDYATLRARQEQERAAGKLVGIGISSYVELCGVGPSWLAPPGVGFWDVSTVKMEPTGKVSVLTGISPHGQGEETTFAQIAADELGVSIDDVRVYHSDTATTPYGNGTYGSRGMAVGGGALMLSLGKLKDKARQYGAHMLGASVDELEYRDGGVSVIADPSRRVTIQQIAGMAYDFSWKGPGTTPTDLEPGLEATSRFEPSNLTFPFGTHICHLEIDPDTGAVQIHRLVAVDDCGTLVNPLIVEGQVHGGIAQGIGQALFEGAVYDANGQLITGELMEYAIPKAAMLGRFETHHTVTPTPVNPLGAKGVGEAGTIGATAAVFGAVMDALAPLGVEHVDMPFKPDKLWAVIQHHRQAATSAVTAV
jgi:aerobic carbon-monoxide dehydrogenase large subunit